MRTSLGVSDPLSAMAVVLEPEMSNKTDWPDANGTAVVLEIHRLFVSQLAVLLSSQIFAPPPRQTSCALETGGTGTAGMSAPR